MKPSPEEVERHRAESRLWVQRDAANLAASARDAWQIGYQEGLELGRLTARILLLQQFLGQTEPSSEELRRFSHDELLWMEDALILQLAGKKQADEPPGAAPAP